MIKYKNFIIKPSGFERYDLYKFAIINKDTDKEREGEYPIAFAQTFQKTLENILIILTDEKCQQEEIDTLMGYIEASREVMNELKTIKI